MASTRNPPVKGLANVLRDQTAPNTLGGIGPPARAPRRRVPWSALATAAAVAIAVLLALLARAA